MLDAIIYDKVNDCVINLDTGTIFDFDEEAYLESRYNNGRYYITEMVMQLLNENWSFELAGDYRCKQYAGCLFVRSSGGGWNVITPDGEVLDEEDDLGSLPADITADFDFGRSSHRAYGISEGFKVGERNGNYFVSLDNSTVIHNVRVAQQ